MNGPVLIAIGVAMLIDVRLAGGLAICVGVFLALTYLPFRR